MKGCKDEAWGIKVKIESAFKDIPYPGDENIVASDYQEALDVAEHFRGVRWMEFKDIPSKFLSMRYSGDIFWLTPKAFQYFLPIYMIQSLIDYKAADLLPGEIVTSFAPPPDKPGLIKQVSKKISLMNPAQLNAILLYLEFFKREHSRDFSTWPINLAIANIQQAISGLQSNPT